MKQETLEEAAEWLYPIFDRFKYDEDWVEDVTKRRDDFIEGAKWQQYNSNINALDFEIDALKREIKVLKYQQQISYSEEDMIEFGEWMKILPLTISGFVIKDTNIVIKTTKELLKYWFEKFKKK